MVDQGTHGIGITEDECRPMGKHKLDQIREIGDSATWNVFPSAGRKLTAGALPKRMPKR